MGAQKGKDMQFRCGALETQVPGDSLEGANRVQRRKAKLHENLSTDGQIIRVCAQRNAEPNLNPNNSVQD